MYVFLSGAGCKLRVMCVYINGIMLNTHPRVIHWRRYSAVSECVLQQVAFTTCNMQKFVQITWAIEFYHHPFPD